MAEYTPPGGAGGGVAVTNQRPFDPAQMIFVAEEFTGGLLSPSGELGELGWGIAGGSYTFRGDESGHAGILRMATAASGGSYVAIFDNLSAVGTVVPTNNFDVTWIVRLNNNDADTLMRVGLAQYAGSNPPVDGIYFEKLAADTQWFGVTRTASSQTRTSALASVTSNFVRLRLKRVNGSTVSFSLDGGAETNATATIPTVGLHRFSALRTAVAVSKTCDLDYSDLLITGLSR